ncbi:hypothetical protein ACQ5SO_07490 [Rhodovulum sp. DZ06]|uniref:hypothetical protein n=1 Tax=Rhodovulum sp. DZ06 TaxID=3425126 RepID=UPI003D33D1D7
MVDFMGAATVASQALGIAKGLYETDKALDDTKLKLQIVEMTQKLLELSQAITAMNSKISDLEHELAKKARRKSVGNLQVEIDDSDDPIGNPFCPVCLAKGLEIKLQNRQSEQNKLICPNRECNSVVFPEGIPDAKPVRVKGNRRDRDGWMLR